MNFLNTAESHIQDEGPFTFQYKSFFFFLIRIHTVRRCTSTWGLSFTADLVHAFFCSLHSVLFLGPTQSEFIFCFVGVLRRFYKEFQQDWLNTRVFVLTSVNRPPTLLRTLYIQSIYRYIQWKRIRGYLHVKCLSVNLDMI